MTKECQTDLLAAERIRKGDMEEKRAFTRAYQPQEKVQQALPDSGPSEFATEVPTPGWRNHSPMEEKSSAAVWHIWPKCFYL
jgi:hypothetical protein